MKKILLYASLLVLGFALGALFGTSVSEGTLRAFKKGDRKVDPLTQSHGKEVASPMPRLATIPPTLAPQPPSSGLQVTLQWSNYNDLDLHMIEPGGDEIWHENRRSTHGGVLDVERNASDYTNTPVEHIDYQNSPPEGRYRVRVVYHKTHTEAPIDTPFKVYVKQTSLGELKEYEGRFPANTPLETTLDICDFDVRKSAADR